MTQVSMLAPGTDSPLPSSPHNRNAFGRSLDRGDVFTTAAINTGFTAAVPEGRDGVTIEPVTELGS